MTGNGSGPIRARDSTARDSPSRSQAGAPVPGRWVSDPSPTLLPTTNAVHTMLPIFVTSIVSGALYALAAIGLVVTYRSSGVFNFAHGAIGMFIAYCYWYFTIRHHWPVLLAMAISILVIAPVIGIGLE